MDDQKLVQTIKSDVSWVQRHERIVLAALILMAVLFLGNKYLNNSAKNADNKAAISAQQLADQKLINDRLAAENARTSQEYLQIVAQLQQQNEKLAAAVTARNTALAKQQGTDKTLPLPELAKRWQGLAGLNDGDLTASASGVSVNDSGARQTVIQLEQVPVLQANFKDSQARAQNNQVQLTEANKVISGLNGQVSGLNAQIGDEEKKCKTEVAAVKADNRKSKRNWFIGGLIAGAGLVAHFVL